MLPPNRGYHKLIIQLIEEEVLKKVQGKVFQDQEREAKVSGNPDAVRIFG